LDHHQIILPLFSASGIDLALLKKETGFSGIFGPAYAKDIPLFLQKRNSIYQLNKADFSLAFRLEMLLSMNFIIWVAVGMIPWFIEPALVLSLLALFWMGGLILYGGYPLIPGKMGG